MIEAGVANGAIGPVARGDGGLTPIQWAEGDGGAGRKGASPDDPSKGSGRADLAADGVG